MPRRHWASAPPTDVAVAPNGDTYVVDGYGSQRVFRFDRQFKLLKTIGGTGTEHGLDHRVHFQGQATKGTVAVRLWLSASMAG